MPRAIASLTISFGLVSIPVRLYAATESKSAIRFKLMSRGGAQIRQRYVADDIEDPVSTHEQPEVFPTRPPLTGTRNLASKEEPATNHLKLVATPTARASKEPQDSPPEESEPPATERWVERADVVKGYEFERGKFVIFTAEELKALQASSRQTIDIVSFVPVQSVDPVYYDKAYYLAPDRRGARPYSLLLAALQASNRSALAKWAWRAKEYVVQIRPVAGGLVLQQLLYADEVRSIGDVDPELVPVGSTELELATRLIDQQSEDVYDPASFVDEEKLRILAAVEAKIAGRKTVSTVRSDVHGAEIVDLVAALRASIKPSEPPTQKSRKPARRASAVAATTPVTRGTRARR